MWQSVVFPGLCEARERGTGYPRQRHGSRYDGAGEVAKYTGPGHDNLTNCWRVFGSAVVNFVYSSMGSGGILLFDHHATEKCTRQQDEERHRDWILLLTYVLNGTTGCFGEAAGPRLKAAACAMANSGLGLEIG